MISRTTFCSAPGVGDPLRPNPADAGHLAQPLGLRLDDVEHLFAERPDQLAGVDRADAPDHARAEILLDPLDRGGRGRANEARPELLAVSAVVDPLTRGGDPLSGRHRGGMADHGNQVAMTARPGPQHAEAVLRIVKGDALDRPGQDLPVRRSRLPAGRRVSRRPERRRAVGSSLTNLKRRASLAEVARSSSSGSQTSIVSVSRWRRSRSIRARCPSISSGMNMRLRSETSRGNARANSGCSTAAPHRFLHISCQRRSVVCSIPDLLIPAALF